jgi:hypothetical protein
MVIVTAVTMREMSYLQKNAIIFQACAGFQCNLSVEGASQMNWSGESGDCWSMENDEANDVLTSFTVTTKCFMKNVMYCDNKVLHGEHHMLWQKSASWRTSFAVTKDVMKNYVRRNRFTTFFLPILIFVAVLSCLEWLCRHFICFLCDLQ